VFGTIVYEGFSAKLLFTSTRKLVKLVISVGGSSGLEVIHDEQICPSWRGRVT
jgi:hypothetical protein